MLSLSAPYCAPTTLRQFSVLLPYALSRVDDCLKFEGRSGGDCASKPPYVL